MNDRQLMNKAADNIRILAASMVEKAKSGHPGGAMGGADFVNVLFSEFLIFDPDSPRWPGRDRFFLDPGHMSPMLYSQLAMIGKYSMEDLQNFRQWGSCTPGHPEVDVERGVENTSGPLGQGHTYAVGAAIAAKFLAHRFGWMMSQTIYAYISDGGIQEEISQGAGRIAGHLGLDNLVMFYDSNNVQLSTKVEEVSSEDIAMKYRAWGWHIIEVDGHDVEALRKALSEAKAIVGKPTLIIGHTVMGKGAISSDGGSGEDRISTHGQPLSKAGICMETTIKSLGGDPSNPFVIFPEVEQLYRSRLEELRELSRARKTEENRWRAEHPELSCKYDAWFANELPAIDWESIEQKPNQATRSASATVLAKLSESVENMIVTSADLSNSDKTDGFLKHTHAMRKGDFSGAFLQMGVSELTMACLTIGMALHGGVTAASGTFFVFSDYMKPAIRMAALMELPVKFIWTHDAFRVGEDGPTHEPVEHEAQIRLLEKLQNHSGENAMLVLRPADAIETTIAWQMAIENRKTPTALILSRQDIADLPASAQGRYNDATKARYGAYVVEADENPEIVLLASGSEVSTLAEAAKLLRAEGHRLQIVSVPSEGLFAKQAESYRESVLPRSMKKFGLTAGLPVNLLSLVGDESAIWGLNSFGFSAPYKVLDEKLGFTPEQVAARIKEQLTR
ncbi:transketolase [Porphyromonas crevioricanis]|uniref:transketolase n=2 Tax=Porphyromonas crevioricanis TaxID=393921 RepID=A0A0A2G0G4_9PORP|nr:transketolase [Porphyromonas crevioricanis]KGN90792.1 transketolase [Porphyromonas crevioricanis]KGN93964.1 transketolase [Porphyromonas crevioricanis]SJZ63588.1 transketolase [Porphyromonas crevioricanis]SQH72896.1 Transketolase [Porphyromonas crevioricanis]GAD04575.1 transketolase [Porphyromonas crevioricanis JCM 15906]